MKQFSSMLDSVTTKVKSFNQTPLEKKVSEATSNENWGVANSALIELARETNDFNNFAVIMKGIWEGLADKKEKWRRIYKALVLLEYCLKYGSERVCNEARSEVYKIRPLQDFKHMEEGRDKGMGIRDKAKAVADLLGDAEQLKAERAKATESKEKFVGVSSNGAQAMPAGYRPSPQGASAYASTPNSSSKPMSGMGPDGFSNSTDKLEEYRERDRKRREEQERAAAAHVVKEPVISGSGKVVVKTAGLASRTTERKESTSSSSSSASSSPVTGNLIDFDSPVVVPKPAPHALPSGSYQVPQFAGQAAQPAPVMSNPYAPSAGHPYGQPAPMVTYSQAGSVNPYAQAGSVNIYAQAAPVNPYAQAAPVNPYAAPVNPYAQAAPVNPYMQSAGGSYPQAAPVVPNPYMQSGSGAYTQTAPAPSNPYAQPYTQAPPTAAYGQQPAASGANPFAAFNGL